MGPSGSGKSTLLDLVSDRKLQGFYSGDIRVNGKIRSNNFGKHTAYVLQKSLFLTTLTVEESIFYAVWTRVASIKTREARQNRVDELIKLLKLEDVRKTKVGDEMTRGISGGQLKRLSIAIELVHLPDVIFLDEPTSGLDSSMSLEVISSVKEIVGSQRLCISTIHSPSPETFALFDQLILLSDGRVIYSGRVDEAIPYFCSSALGYYYVSGENPAEFVIAVCNGKLPPQNSDLPRSAVELELLFAQTPISQQEEEGRSANFSATDSTRYHEYVEETSMWTQLQMLLHRGFISRIRDVADLRAHFMKNLVVGLLVGILFYRQVIISPPFFIGQAISPQVTGVNAILFLTIMFGAVANLQSIPMLCDQSAIFRQEVAARAYHPVPYWLANLIVPLPFLLVFHFVFFITVYYLVGFPNDADLFFPYAGIVFLHNLVVFVLGFFLASITGSSQIAIALYPIIFVSLIQFAGFLINLRSIPPGWIWAPYISFSRWTLQGLMVIIWSRYGSAGDQIITSFAFDGMSSGDIAWILFGFIGGFAVLALWRMFPPRKNLKYISSNDSSPSAKQSSKTREGDYIVSGSSNSKHADVEAANSDNLEKNQEEKERSIEMRTLEGESLSVIPIKKPSQQWFEAVPVTSNENEEHLYSAICVLTFLNLTYTVADHNHKSKELTILRDISGDIQPGEMCALMGSSGAGKSTLLDLLAQRKNTGRTEGTILYNNQATPPSIAYVLQDNVHIPLLTVRETLYYGALLRLPEGWTDERKRKRVETILRMLSLEHVAESLVGSDTMRGISGGQLKRLSIGVEIIHLPSLMFLDEPTTGLDSATAYEVMSAVRRLANQRRTIVATIHQPSRHSFELFDKLILLAKGKIIYFGSNRNSDVIDYFTLPPSPFQFAYDTSRNPAEFIIDIAGGNLCDAHGQIADAARLASSFEKRREQDAGGQAAVDKSLLADAEAGAPAMIAAPIPNEQGDDDSRKNGNSQFTTSTWNQVVVLLRRGATVLSRDRAATVLSLVRHIVISLFFGTIYFNLQTGTDFAAYTNRMGLLYFNTVFFILSNIQALPALIDQRLIFYRERGARAYGAFSYWISVWMIQLPVMAVNVLIYAVILYHLVGLRPGAQYFFYFYYVLLLMSLWAVQLAGFIASIATSTQTALSYFPIIMFINVGFAGYLIFIPQFPPWLGNWGPYVSVLRFAFQSLILNEFEDNPELPLANTYLSSMGFEQLSKTSTALILIPFYFFFNLAFFLGLKFVNFEKR
jgi:ABC-type multidrug transport system ATPase subunit/ABC-type multidrug transport system permease subunit